MTTTGRLLGSGRSADVYEIDVTESGLTEARRRRAANPTMSRREVEVLADAEGLVRAVGRLG